MNASATERRFMSNQVFLSRLIGPVESTTGAGVNSLACNAKNEKFQGSVEVWETPGDE